MTSAQKLREVITSIQQLTSKLYVSAFTSRCIRRAPALPIGLPSAFPKSPQQRVAGTLITELSYCFVIIPARDRMLLIRHSFT